jgi:hypothetical protein
VDRLVFTSGEVSCGLGFAHVDSLPDLKIAELLRCGDAAACVAANTLVQTL